MTRSHHSHAEDIRIYGVYMAASTARSLELLRKIERTKLALRSIANDAHVFAGGIEEMTARIAEEKEAIAEDEILPVYEDIQDKLESLHRALHRRCALAKRDLRVGDEDSRYEAFGRALNGVDKMHQAVEVFRWVVMEHNADTCEPRGEVLSHPMTSRRS